VVTVTSTVPAASGGEVAVMEEAELTAKVVAATAPNVTVVTPVKLVPVIVTEVPPAVTPEFGLTPVTVGGGGVVAVNLNWSDGGLTAEVPAGVVTVTSTVPVASGGEVAVMEEAELTTKVAAAVAPNLTAVAPVTLVPVIVTEVPPALSPEFGLRPVTVGPGGGAEPDAADTLSMVTVPRVPLLCDVTARPSSTVGPRLMVNVEPGIRVQVTPSAEVYAVKVVPERVTFT
jgi:hypothetical protein